MTIRPTTRRRSRRTLGATVVAAPDLAGRAGSANRTPAGPVRERRRRRCCCSSMPTSTPAPDLLDRVAAALAEHPDVDRVGPAVAPNGRARGTGEHAVQRRRADGIGSVHDRGRSVRLDGRVRTRAGDSARRLRAGRRSRGRALDAHRRHRTGPGGGGDGRCSPADPTRRSACTRTDSASSFDGWTRSIATGARADPLVADHCHRVLDHGDRRWLARPADGRRASPVASAVIYAASAVQVWVLGRRAGSIHPLTAAAVPDRDRRVRGDRRAERARPRSCSGGRDLEGASGRGAIELIDWRDAVGRRPVPFGSVRRSAADRRGGDRHRIAVVVTRARGRRTVAAHDGIASSDPASGSVIEDPIDSVTIDFGADIGDTAQIALLAPDGTQIASTTTVTSTTTATSEFDTIDERGDLHGQLPRHVDRRRPRARRVDLVHLRRHVRPTRCHRVLFAAIAIVILGIGGWFSWRARQRRSRRADGVDETRGTARSTPGDQMSTRILPTLAFDSIRRWASAMSASG